MDTTQETTFKPRKQRNLRRRKSSSDEEETTRAKLDDTKEKQKLRNRPHGVNIMGLALGKKISLEDAVTVKDQFNIKSGGMVNMQALKAGGVKKVDDAYDTGIGTQFSAETNKRDEDEEMMKYIDDQLHQKKGAEQDHITDDQKYMTPEEAAILSLPKHLRISSSQKNEEMLSNQMLNGIPEVDLGIEAKIKNIEATEEAKIKLMDQKNKKDAPSAFIPKNMAVNFMQHNRFNIEQTEQPKKRQPVADPQANTSTQLSKQKPQQKRATDDYHFDKFKKQFRRH